MPEILRNWYIYFVKMAHFCSTNTREYTESHQIAVGIATEYFNKEINKEQNFYSFSFIGQWNEMKWNYSNFTIHTVKMIWLFFFRCRFLLMYFWSGVHTCHTDHIFITGQSVNMIFTHIIFSSFLSFYHFYILIKELWIFFSVFL